MIDTLLRSCTSPCGLLVCCPDTQKCISGSCEVPPLSDCITYPQCYAACQAACAAEEKLVASFIYSNLSVDCICGSNFVGSIWFWIIIALSILIAIGCIACCILKCRHNQPSAPPPNNYQIQGYPSQIVSISTTPINEFSTLLE